MPSKPINQLTWLTSFFIIVFSVLAVGALLTHFSAFHATVSSTQQSFSPNTLLESKTSLSQEGSLLTAFQKNKFGFFLFQLLAIFPVAHVLGRLMVRVGQPPVVGEILAGICLGPSILGFLLPDVYEFIFPAKSLGPLRLMSQIGILIFMFIIGMEAKVGLVKNTAKKAFFISQAGVVVPFILTITLSNYLYGQYSPAGVSFNAFALFMGISMSVTAFPVLAKIIEGQGLLGTPLGTLTLASAAIGDVTAWAILAFIVAGIDANSKTNAFFMAGAIMVFLISSFLVVKPLLQKLYDKFALRDSNQLTLTLVVIFFFSLCTEMMGIHALFGAFVAGFIMPKEDRFQVMLRERLEYFTSAFLLPIFFAIVGVRTHIGLLNSFHDWAVCLLVLAVAIIGKWGGTYMASRYVGIEKRDALIMGSLMNSRGLMEVIIINLGYDLGIFSEKIFAIMMIMAIVTTFMTSPLVSIFMRKKTFNES